MLPAISAIASDMAIHLGYQYYAGLWIQDVARGLAWKTHGFGAPSPVWRGPTWSWAALDCFKMVLEYNREYRWITETFREDEYTLKLSRIPAQLGPHVLLDPPASLDVEALVLPFASWPETAHIQTDIEKIHNRFSMDRFVHLQCEFDLMRAEDEDQYCVDDLVHSVLVRLGTWIRADSGQRDEWKFGYALMDERNGDGTYSRVGMAKIPETEMW